MMSQQEIESQQHGIRNAEQALDIEALRNEDVNELRAKATNASATAEDSYKYAMFLLFNVKIDELNVTIDQHEADTAVAYLLEVADSNDERYKYHACLMVGFLLSETNPKRAEEYLQKVKNHNECSAEACQLLANIYQSGQYKYPLGDLVKALAYYSIAVARDVTGKKLRGLDQLQLLYSQCLLKEYNNAEDQGDAELACDVLRCQYQEGLISAWTYIQKLQELTGRINTNESALTQVLLKCEFQQLRASLHLAYEQDDYNQLERAINYAQWLVCNANYNDTIEQTEAKKLIPTLQSLLDARKTSFLEILKADTTMETLGKWGNLVGLVIGNVCDLLLLTVPKMPHIEITKMEVHYLSSGDLKHLKNWFNSGLGWLGNKCFGFIGKCLGVVIGLGVAAVTYLNSEEKGITETEFTPIYKSVEGISQGEFSNIKGIDSSSIYNSLSVLPVIPARCATGEHGCTGTSCSYSYPLGNTRNLVSNSKWPVPAYDEPAVVVNDSQHANAIPYSSVS
jgi:TPR repeat protein